METPVAETLGVHGFPQIVKSERYVIDHGLADVISQSFGATEETFPNRETILSLRGALASAQSHHVTMLASTGDLGATSYLLGMRPSPDRAVNWPASDPLVTAVGGTHVRLDADGERRAGDTVWNETKNRQLPPAGIFPRASAGGLSSVFERPSYQDSVQTVTGTARGIPDVSLNAAIDGAVVVCASFYGGDSCYHVGYGTSAATPEFAAIVAIADQAVGHRLGLINPLLYWLAGHRSSGIVDVAKGNNTVQYRDGNGMHTVEGWPASRGFDLASGLGTIDADRLVRSIRAIAKHTPG